MGHSFGGTRSPAAARPRPGRAPASASRPGPVKGVPDLPLSTLRTGFPVLGNPFNRNKADRADARSSSTTPSATPCRRAESDRVYERYHVPAANHVLFEGGFANFTPQRPDEGRLHEGRPRAVAVHRRSSIDHIVPPKAARHNVEKYRKSKAITAYKEFPGRPHFPRRARLGRGRRPRPRLGHEPHHHWGEARGARARVALAGPDSRGGLRQGGRLRQRRRPLGAGRRRPRLGPRLPRRHRGQRRPARHRPRPRRLDQLACSGSSTATC